jgi:type I restriction enzyme, S subunit
MKPSIAQKALGDLFAFKNGRAFKKEEWSRNGIPIIRIQNLNSEEAPFNYFAGEYSQDILVEPGDLLFSWSGTVGSSFGPHLWNREKGVLNQHIFKIGLRDSIDKGYAFHALQYITQEIEQSVNGAVGLVHITKAKLNAFTIPVPSLPEQRRILNILDEAFEGITNAKAKASMNLSNARALFESHLQSTLEELGDGSVEKRLGEVCSIARGGSPRPIQKFLTSDPNGINWIKISDATASGKYIYRTEERIIRQGVKRSRLVHEGDFLLSNSMSFGRPYIMRTTGCIHDGWLVLSDYASSLDQDFLYYVLGSQIVFQQFDDLAAGSTVRNLNIELASRVEIPVPPLRRQQEIATQLGELAAATQHLASVYERKQAALEELRASLLQRAFSGQL